MEAQVSPRGCVVVREGCPVLALALLADFQEPCILFFFS